MSFGTFLASQIRNYAGWYSVYYSGAWINIGNAYSHSTVVVSDSASNIVGNIDFLNQAVIDGIVNLKSTGGSLTLSSSQVVSDSAALGNLLGSTAGKYTQYGISDFVLFYIANIDSLANSPYLSKLGTISLIGQESIDVDTFNSLNTYGKIFQNISSASFTISNASLSFLNSNVSLSKIKYFDVIDESGSIANAIYSLKYYSNLGKIHSIAFADAPSTWDISATQFINSFGLIPLIQSNVSARVIDSSSNISTNFNDIASHASLLQGILVSDSQPITLSYSQYVNNTSAIGLIDGNFSLSVTNVSASSVSSLSTNTHITSISVSDTFSNIFANLDIMQSSVSSISQINVTDLGYYGHWYVYANSNSIQQLKNDYEVIEKLPTGVIINLQESAENISNNLETIIRLKGVIDSVYVSDASSVVMSANQNVALGTELYYFYHENAGNYASIQILDSGVNLIANLTKLIGNITSIVLTDSVNPIDITYAQFSGDYWIWRGSVISDAYLLAVSEVAASNVASTLGNSHVSSLTVSDSSSNIASAIDSLGANVSKIASITSSDSSAISLTLSQLASDASVFTKFTSTPNLVVTDTAAHFNNLDLTAYHGDRLDLVVTSLDGDMSLAGGAVTQLDLTNLANATYSIKTINSGADTQVNVTSGASTHAIVLHGELPNQLQISANYTAPITSLNAVGLSPDHSTLIMSFSDGTTTTLPYSAGSGSVALGGTTYQTSDITAHLTPQAVFANATGGANSYVMPTVFSGDPALHLQYQLISSEQNAVITGASSNDFIKLASTNSVGKAVNGGGGTDVIDGGVGSTFISGGIGHTGDTFFLDGRASGTSWSTITDFNLGSDMATIWGFVKGVSGINNSFNDANTGGAVGYTGLTLHFDNLLPDGQLTGSNPDLNSITFTSHLLSEIGASSITDLNNQIANATYNSGTDQYIVNSHMLIGQTHDGLGDHSYLFLH